MECRSVFKVLFVMLLVTALASVSSCGRSADRGGKKGSGSRHHHHHHKNSSGDGKHGGSGGGGDADLVTPSLDEDATPFADVVLSEDGEDDDVVVAMDVPDPPQPPDEEDLDEVTELMNTTENWLTGLLRNASAYIPVSVDYATNVGNFCDPVTYNSGYYNVPSLIISALLFILGALFCFFGYRLIKVNLFLIGFIFAGFVTYSFVLALASSVQEPWVLYVALAAALVTGVVAGVVTICIYHIGLFLIGASVGFLFAWFLLSVINVAYFQDKIYIPVIIAVVAGVASGIVTLAYPKYLVVLGTSAIGAFQIAWALDYFLELGQAVYYLALFAVDRAGLSLCWYSWMVVALCLLLFVAGIIVQLLVTGRKHNHKDDFQRGICCGLCKRCSGGGRDDYVPLNEMK